MERNPLPDVGRGCRVPRGTECGRDHIDRSTGNTITSRLPAALLSEADRELGLGLNASQLDDLLSLGELLISWGQRINLTGHRDLETVVRRLIADAMGLHTVLPGANRIADLGSGAGFPGLPLAILRPSTGVTLVEARERRQHFQKAAARNLALGNVDFRLGRAEQIDADPHAVVVAQAMTQPELALSWMKRWAEPGSWLLVPGGATPPAIDPPPGVEPLPVAHYTVPCGGPRRTVWVGRVS